MTPRDADVVPRSPESIFLTGATGYLGAFILDELLHQTSAVIHVLVRCDDMDAGLERLRNIFSKYRLDSELLTTRVRVVPGDLTQPLLGMPEPSFTRLASEVDTVYHAGADVNFSYPYEVLKPANVDGTREVVRFCVRKRMKRLHHVSALDAMEQPGPISIPEDRELPDQPIRLGYVQSKWAAERIVQAASDRGLLVTIYRPWLVGSHTTTGVCHTTDYILRVLHACLTAGIVPDQERDLNMIPVDYFSRALVHISLNERMRGNAYHLANPKSTPMPTVFDWLRDYGYPLDVLPYDEWREQLIRDLPSTDSGYSVVPLISENPVARDHQRVRISTSRTQAALAGSNIACPPLDKRLIHLTLDYLVDIGYIDAPRQVDRQHV